MIQVFLASLADATAIMLSVLAWLLAFFGLLVALCALVIILGTAFDLATAFLAWFWKLTKHKPTGKLQRIIMGKTGGV